jgi:hypothetical protein
MSLSALGNQLFWRLEMTKNQNIVPIGDRTILIDVPSSYTVEIEEDGTLTAFPAADPKAFNLRFTVLMVRAKDAKKTKEIDLAEDLVADARQRGIQSHRQGALAWFT